MYINYEYKRQNEFTGMLRAKSLFFFADKRSDILCNFAPSFSPMLYLLNKNTTLQLIISAFLLAWSGFCMFTGLSVAPPDGHPLLYGAIYPFLSQHLVFSRALAMALLVLEAVFLQRFFAVNRFSENKTAMSILFFWGMMIVGHQLTLLSPANFTMFALTLIMLINTNVVNDFPLKNRIFISGIIIGVASLLDINALWILLFLIFAILTNRFSRMKDVIILLSGLLFVAVYLFTYGYLTDMLPQLLASYKKVDFFGFIEHAREMRVIDWVSTAMLLATSIYMIVVLKLYYDNKLIVLRNRFMTTVFLWLTMLVAGFFSCYDMQGGRVYIFVPVVLLYSMLCLVKSRRIFHDILIVAMFVLLWF